LYFLCCLIYVLTDQEYKMRFAFLKGASSYFASSLAASTLLQFALRITLVVIAVTLVSYWHIVSSLQDINDDGLRNYISERAQKESDIFRSAERNHIIAKAAFTEYWQDQYASESLDFDRIWQHFSDGTVRIPQTVFDGVMRADGSRSHSISGFVGQGAPIDDLEFRNRLVISYWLVSRFGEAWSKDFPNFYITMPENVVLGYWPGVPWGLEADAEFDITQEEWYYVASPENNPEGATVWTGLYYDYTVDQWMVSNITPVEVDGQHLINFGHDILLNDLFERVFNDRLEGAYNFILRKDGRLIAHPDKVDALREAEGRLYIKELNDTVLTSMYQRIMQGLSRQSGDVLLLDDQQNDVLLAIAPMPGPDWLFVTVYPKSLLTSVALETARFILWLGLISLIVEMFMLYLVFRRKVIEPLNTFALASDHIASGQYDLSRVNGMPRLLKQSNETGLLARTFQRMASDIQSYGLELESKVEARTEQLKQATEEVKKADQAKSDFLARMSHEIHTPMNAIIGLSRLTLNTSLDLDQRAYLEKIQLSADLLMRIINDILDFSKMEAGKLTLEELPFRLHEVMDYISHVIALRVEDKGLEFVSEIDPKVPLYLKGDALRLGQVLINLANNAVNFTYQGQVVIKVWSEQSTDHHATLHFMVQDTGIGMKAEDMKNLFSAFSQADGSIARKYGGPGLGLVICKQLVEMMKGRIWVESEPGKGSQIHFTAMFDLSDGSQFETVDARAACQPGVGFVLSEAECKLMSQARILLVEDNPINRLVVESFLEEFGVEVDSAETGTIALEMLNARRYELVLMDIQMPEMDGLTATRLLRADPRFRDLPIIAMTAHAMSEDREKSLEAGMNDHLVKPVSADQLHALLVKWLVSDAAERSSAKVLAHQFMLPSGPDLPKSLPGIDINEAVEHARYDNALLIKLLKNFYHTYHELPLKIADLEPRRISDLAHTIKPLAIFFGAKRLADSSRNLEQAVRSGSDLGRPCAVFSEALQEVMSGLQELVSQVPEKSMGYANYDPVKAAELLDSLKKLLLVDDANAELILPQLQRCLPGETFASMLAKLEYYIDDIEYEQALELADSLSSKILDEQLI